MMDLVTLVAACSLGIQPNVIHAFVWHQSGAEPWSFLVPGESQLRIYPTLREALREAQHVPHRATLRIGLGGLPAAPGMVTPAVFAPCPNITAASRQIGELLERCSVVNGSDKNPMHCAIAAYRGSLQRPDTRFADAVLASVAKGDAPNFDMPDDAHFPEGDLGSKQLDRARNEAPTTAAVATDERQLGWSSALFPAKAERTRSKPDTDPGATPLQIAPVSTTAPMTRAPQPPSSMNQLFVPRSEQRRPE
jgi:hypothetical protein